MARRTKQLRRARIWLDVSIIGIQFPVAIAIGYSDIVSLFMQTALNQAGYAVEMVGLTMAFYMFISLSISALLNIYNKRVQLIER